MGRRSCACGDSGQRWPRSPAPPSSGWCSPRALSAPGRCIPCPQTHTFAPARVVAPLLICPRRGQHLPGRCHALVIALALLLPCSRHALAHASPRAHHPPGLLVMPSGLPMISAEGPLTSISSRLPRNYGQSRETVPRSSRSPTAARRRRTRRRRDRRDSPRRYDAWAAAADPWWGWTRVMGGEGSRS